MATFKIYKIKQDLFRHIRNDGSSVFGSSESLYISVEADIISFHSKAVGFIYSANFAEIELYEIGSVTPIVKNNVDEVINELIRLDYGFFKNTKQNSSIFVSGTITLGGTAQIIMASNEQRLGFEVQNTSSAPLNLGIGASVTVSTGFVLEAGATYFTGTDIVSTRAIWLIGATTGQTFTFIEY